RSESPMWNAGLLSSCAPDYPPPARDPSRTLKADDFSGHPRIRRLRNLMAALGPCRTPFDTLQTIRHGMSEAYGSAASILLCTRGLSDGEYRLVQLHLDDGDSDVHDPWLRRESPVHRGGVIAAIIANPNPQIVNDVDWSGDPRFSERLAGYSSLLAIPLESE